MAEYRYKLNLFKKHLHNEQANISPFSYLQSPLKQQRIRKKIKYKKIMLYIQQMISDLYYKPLVAPNHQIGFLGLFYSYITLSSLKISKILRKKQLNKRRYWTICYENQSQIFLNFYDSCSSTIPLLTLYFHPNVCYTKLSELSNTWNTKIIHKEINDMILHLLEKNKKNKKNFEKKKGGKIAKKGGKIASRNT